MTDPRSKSIRVSVETNKAAKTLAAYLDSTMDQVVAQAIETLWREKFPKVPMPGDKPKGKRKR